METGRMDGSAGPGATEPQRLRAMVRRFRRRDGLAAGELELPAAYRALDIAGPAGSGFTIIGVRREAPATR
jgi:hypothetical protein